MATDPNVEWLGHVQPVGLVVSPVVLADRGQNPAEQTRFDSDAVRALLSEDEAQPALADTWSFFNRILGWRTAQVAGAPDGAPVPDELSLRIEESDTEVAPTWAVSQPGGGWQLLVIVEALGIQPDARGALEGWEATPHQRLERLLREKGVPAGILLTDEELRFIYAPRGETSGWLAFPLRSLGDVGGRPMLGGLKLLLSSFQLHNAAPEHRLLALLKASRDAQAEVSTKLAGQVLGALHELLRGLHAADRSRVEALAATQQEHLYDGLLTVLLRLVFLLYAEDRDLVPSRTDGDARAIYDQGYGVRALHARLLDNSAHYPDTMDERRGAWPQLLALFRLVYQGDGTGWIRGRGGKLFDPAEFPFLQGQDTAGGHPSPASVSDGTILRILDGLLTLDGEKLSYRTLDVEQIGSVYETVMGFTIETRPGPGLAIRAGKNDRTPVFVDVAALLATKGSDRAKFLKEKASRNALGDKVAKSLSVAEDQAAVVAALRPIIDQRGSPGGEVSPPGTPLLQPTDERRRTGSHYTPRSLTAPIVEHALEPAFERLGPDVLPEQILELKVCDPAMGSGAFLVEACRALGERLVRAWVRWPLMRPTIPPDEDELLHAKRLVAQRCLYGVDKNPRAVDLAKLSLWLATLARDHEFTFLDHALKCGDSLVGLTKEQIAGATWDDGKPALPLFRQLVRERVAKAQTARAEIQGAPDDTMRVILEAKHRDLEAIVSPVRAIGDAILSAFFAEDKSKARERRRADVESWMSGIQPRWELIGAAANELRQGEHGVVPFHWQLEYPEVFDRVSGGFDAIVGNPPFAGKNTIIEGNRSNYLPWLQTLHLGAHGNADLAAHFFRRSFSLLRPNGTFGLIATNTISQGDTREAALVPILQQGGAIARAVRHLKWPGEAAVSVMVLHVKRGSVNCPILDGQQVSRISAYVFKGEYDQTPHTLQANTHRCFQGTNLVGVGFTFDDVNHAKGLTASLSEMSEVVRDGRYEARIRPFLGGEELNSEPAHLHRRYVIDLEGLSQAEAQSQWPALYEVVRQYVKPARDRDNRDHRRLNWWLHGEPQKGLYRAIGGLSSVLAVSRVAPNFGIARIPANIVFADSLVVFAFSTQAALSVLQSRVHELWARYFSSTLEDRLRYSPSDCFRTFPLPQEFEGNPRLQAVGQAYDDCRSTLMIARNDGLTKTYNRFHDSGEQVQDIRALRNLHAEMDAAVLSAYGWEDLAHNAKPEFIEQEADEGKRAKTRFDWPAEFKDEVLTRLLALNSERAAVERAAGLVVASEDDEDDGLDE